MPFLPPISLSDLSASTMTLPLCISFLRLCSWHSNPSLQSLSFWTHLHRPPNLLPVGTFAFLYAIPHTVAKASFYKCSQILFFSPANPLKASHWTQKRNQTPPVDSHSPSVICPLPPICASSDQPPHPQPPHCTLRMLTSLHSDFQTPKLFSALTLCFLH